MKKRALITMTSWFMIVWFPCFVVLPCFAQIEDEFSEDLFSDEVEKTIIPLEKEPITEKPEEEEFIETVKEEKKEAVQEEFLFEDTVETTPAPLVLQPERTYAPEKTSLVQNAVLEGIQISKEPGDKEDEHTVTCYFIFRDKPTSYFYDIKKKQKIIEFEFTDVVQGSSPVPSITEQPIQRFKIESKKVDVNKDVVGLIPEWHDIIKVIFYFDQVPRITVNDEYSIISFSFNWSSSGKSEGFVDKERSRAPFFIAVFGGIGAAGAAGLVLFFTKENGGDDPVVLPLEGIEGVITHPDPVDTKQ